MGEDTITITGGSSDNDTIVINLNDTYGTTTSYLSHIDTSTIGSSYTINTNDTISITDLNWTLSIEDTHLEVAEIEKMCAEYPALAKVYENFKTMYDLVKQDWEGKKNAENNL
jgi:hypothetical protein